MKEKRAIYFTMFKMQNCKLAGGRRGVRKKWYNGDSDNQTKKKANQRKKKAQTTLSISNKDKICPAGSLLSNRLGSRVARRMGSSPKTSCVTTMTTTTMTTTGRG